MPLIWTEKTCNDLVASIIAESNLLDFEIKESPNSDCFDLTYCVKYGLEKEINNLFGCNICTKTLTKMIKFNTIDEAKIKSDGIADELEKIINEIRELKNIGCSKSIYWTQLQQKYKPKIENLLGIGIICKIPK